MFKVWALGLGVQIGFKISGSGFRFDASVLMGHGGGEEGYGGDRVLCLWCRPPCMRLSPVHVAIEIGLLVGSLSEPYQNPLGHGWQVQMHHQPRW